MHLCIENPLFVQMCVFYIIKDNLTRVPVQNVPYGTVPEVRGAVCMPAMNIKRFINCFACGSVSKCTG